MSKSDKTAANNAIGSAQTTADNTYNSGLATATQRQADVQNTSDQQENDIYSGYQSLANPTGGLTQAQINSLTPGAAGYMGNGVSGGGASVSGVGTGVASGYPDYLSTYNDLQGATGGFDPTTLNDINSTVSSLANTGGNYGATDTSISGLQNFAATGGVSADDISKIDNPTLEEFSQDGGYTPEDIANIRARGNSGAASTYQNLSDSLNKQQLISGQSGPGWSQAGFKLARQGAQAAGDSAVNTDIGINDSIRTGRMSAASTLADKMTALAGLQSQNTLSGYTNAGNLDEQKQQQVNQALESSGDLDLNKQGLINQTRLSAAGGLSQDYLGRASINAQASAAQAAIDAANSRALLGYETGQEDTGLSGMLQTYGTAPAQLMNDQTNTLNWANSQTAANQGLINDRIGASNISTTPDWMGSLAPIGNLVSGAGNLIGGITGGSKSQPQGTIGTPGNPSSSIAPIGNATQPLNYYNGATPNVNSYIPSRTQLMGYYS